MTAHLVLDADLAFAVEAPDGRQVTGRLHGSGSRLELEVSDPTLFAGRNDTSTIGALAGALASSGLAVTVVAPSGPLVTLGATSTRWWHRRVTRSRHIRIEHGALWTLARGRARASAAGALPSPSLVPAGMLWPLAPTFLRRVRRVTTTHDPGRGGNPRLIMAPGNAFRPHDDREVFALAADVTTIGSAEDSDIRLPGLEPRHAEVRHDERDELVLHRLGRPGSTRVNGAEVDESVLLTASRVQLGEWTLTFSREEYADHGRPHGGRAGGELGRNKAQPARGRVQPGSGR